MLVNIYWTIWGLFSLAFILLFATNNLTPVNLVGLGFFTFGLTFMGMMGVLPTLVSHPAAPKQKTAARVSVEAAREPHAEGFHVLKSA